MSYVRYVPIDPPAEDPHKGKVSQWSVGIAMFAAFVLPFVLLAASARYRTLILQAKHRFDAISSVASGAAPLSADGRARDSKQND